MADKGNSNNELEKLMGSINKGEFTPDDLTKMTKLMTQDGPGDLSALENAPGVVVDKKDGSVRLFGFKMPGVPPVMAQAIAIGYSQAANVITDYIGPKSYNAVKGLATKQLGLSETLGHRAGIGMELGSVLTTAHWQDVTAAWRAKGEYSADIAKFSHRVAPIVDELRGRHGVGPTMSIKKDENEVLWAERQRLHTELRIELLGILIAAAGRAPVTVAHVLTHKDRWDNGGIEATDRDRLTRGKEDVQTAKQKAYDAQVKQYTSKVNEYTRDGLSQQRAEELASKAFKDINVNNPKKGGAANGEPRNMLNEITRWAPAIGTAISEGWSDNFVKDQKAKISMVSAYDMIMTLNNQLEDDPEMKSYDYPKGMALENGKRSVSLEEYIAEIFRRHEADMDPEGKIAKRLNEKLKDASHVIAEAIRDGDIDGLSLISLVGERHIVRRGAKTISDKEHTRNEVRVQMVKAHRHNTVDEAEYYAERSFTKNDLKMALESLEGEERTWFATLFPDNVLEGAGVSQADIKTIRAASQEDIGKHVLQYAQGLEEKGEEFLKTREATREEQKRIKEAANTPENNEKAVRDLVSKPGKVMGVQHDIAQVLVQHIKHDGTLSDIANPKAVNDNENAINDNIAGDPDMQIDAASIQHDKHAANEHTLH